MAELPEIIRQQQADDRAIELALFFGINLEEAKDHLGRGFGDLHAEVTADFKANASEENLIEWYRTTEAYIWELSAYHANEGFNYAGMCEGIGTRLLSEFDKYSPVMCLGDGIGDLTLSLHNLGFDSVYHDLCASRTSEYAKFRFNRQIGQEMKCECTGDWTPHFGEELYRAVVSLDFLEHVPNVEEWVRAIHTTLKPGGLFCAQNAFAIGSGPDGGMPMHLAVNDHYENDWDTLLSEVGFEQEAPQWYRKRS
jgi:hypothetical protein